MSGDPTSLFPNHASLVALVSAHDAWLWQRFEIDDNALLSGGAVGFNAEHQAVWVGSVAGMVGVRKMLREIGWLMRQGFSIDLVAYRTENATVEKWGRRFLAWKVSKPGHRPRWLFEPTTEFREICLKA